MCERWVEEAAGNGRTSQISSFARSARCGVVDCSITGACTFFWRSSWNSAPALSTSFIAVTVTIILKSHVHCSLATLSACGISFAVMGGFGMVLLPLLWLCFSLWPVVSIQYMFRTAVSFFLYHKRFTPPLLVFCNWCVTSPNRMLFADLSCLRLVDSAH